MMQRQILIAVLLKKDSKPVKYILYRAPITIRIVFVETPFGTAPMVEDVEEDFDSVGSKGFMDG